MELLSTQLCVAGYPPIYNSCGSSLKPIQWLQGMTGCLKKFSRCLANASALVTKFKTRTEYWPQAALWVFHPNFATCKGQLSPRY